MTKIRDKIVSSIENMGLTEKVLFYSFLIIAVLAFGVILQKTMDNFTVSVPASGGTLVEGMSGYPRYVNPVIVTTDAGRSLDDLIYSGLLKAMPDGTLAPDLAKDWSVSSDGLTYTVDIKDNAYFQDGKPVTAEDVQFTIKEALDPSIKSDLADNWQGVAVNVINDKQIQFVLKKPYTPFVNNLTLGILPMYLWQNTSADAFSFSPLNVNAIGSGPYEIKDIKTETSGLPDYYHLVANGQYALGKPYINDIYIKFYPNEQAVIAAYQSGEISSIANLSPDNAKLLESKGAPVITSPLPRIFALFFNQNQSKILAHSEVRAALDLTAPRAQIITDVLDGYGAPATGPLPYFIPSSTSTPASATTTLSEANKITKAKAILEKAGWKLGADGIYQKAPVKTSSKSATTTGERLEFSISTSDVPALKETAADLQTEWKKIGVAVDIKVFELSDLEQNAIVPRNYDALLFGEVIGRDGDLFDFWHSSERADPGLNVALYTNSAVDTLLSKIRAEADPAKKASLYASLSADITSDIPAVFLYSPDFIFIPDPSVKGLDIRNIFSPSDQFLSVSKWYVNTERVLPIFTK